MNRLEKFGVIASFFFVILCAFLISAEDTALVSWELNETKINDAFECLENKTIGKASSVSFEELIFTILASPKSSVLSEYKTELISRKQSVSDDQECWPKSSCKIKETALALIALSHLGENTEKVEEWLLSKNKTATEITWLLQEDSESETRCTITYDQIDYDTTVLIDKKISDSAGPCLPIYQNDFWFQVSANCYDKEFVISCDKNFLANLLYKRAGSNSIIYVDSKTQSSPALGEVKLEINSKCFGLSNCEYEGSLWATLALLKEGYDIQSFVPYLIALSDSNKAYLPESFLYTITGFEDYSNWLIQNQNLGSYWQAEGTPNGKYYDTSLALIALSNSNAEQVAKARKKMESYQDKNGCWMSSKPIRDTAIMLWALAGRAPSIQVVPSVTYCSEAGFYCVDQLSCSTPDQLGDNYYCSGGRECCRTQNLQTCSELEGQKCPTDKECSGNTVQASDESSCCLLSCVEPVTDSECEGNDNYCFTSCPDSYTSINQECNGNMACCKYNPKDKDSSGSGWLIWLIIGIIILIAIIAYIKREAIKLWWFKQKHKVNSTNPNNSSYGPGFRGPPFTGRPGGFPPSGQAQMIRRPMPVRPAFTSARPINQKPQSTPDKLIPEDDETFRKLREMSK